jgi:hypothetical protein
MKTIIPLCSAAIILFVTTFHAGADIVAGPITNPANGHDYYLLSPNSWTASESEAENLGGTLAVIKSAAEEEWVFSKFASYDGMKRNLWIGLRRTFPGGPFAWVTDDKVDYTDWHSGQPDNGGGTENCVHIWTRNSDNPNSWNDLADNWPFGDDMPCGVVEAPGASDEKSLTEKEKSLIGTWYESGNVNHSCWITGTENRLFQIYDGRAVRLVLTAEGSLFLSNRIRGEIVKDKILWSNGTWWSRKPMEYKTSEKPETTEK